jgi:hypothetical protein
VQIGLFVKEETFVEREPFTGEDFLFDLREEVGHGLSKFVGRIVGREAFRNDHYFIVPGKNRKQSEEITEKPLEIPLIAQISARTSAVFMEKSWNRSTSTRPCPDLNQVTAGDRPVVNRKRPQEP